MFPVGEVSLDKRKKHSPNLTGLTEDYMGSNIGWLLNTVIERGGNSLFIIFIFSVVKHYTQTINLKQDRKRRHQRNKRKQFAK